MARPTSPTVSRKELAATLKQLRTKAGKTLEEAAAELELSSATVSRIENGVRVPRARDVKDLCRFYGVTDPVRVAELAALVAGAKESGWWEAYDEVDEAYATFIGFEVAATEVQDFENSIVPAILQTADYGRAQIRGAAGLVRNKPVTDHEIAELIEVRSRRQQRIFDDADLRYTLILDEAVLRRVVGDRQVMAEQIAHLIHVSDTTSAEILVLPFDRGSHPGQLGAFMILTMPQSQVPDVVYIDSLAGQLFLDTPDEIHRYRRVFNELDRLGLDAVASGKFLLSQYDYYR